MENRFGLKDVFLAALLLLVAGLVALAMVQYDHQWDTIKRISSKLDEQGRDLIAIRQRLDRGLAMTPGTVVSVDPADDPSARVRAATTQPGYATGDWYVASAPNSDKLTPLVSGDAFAATVQGLVFETLVDRDPVTLDYRGVLAQPGWTVEDHIAAYHAFVDPKIKAGAKEEDACRDQACPAPIRVTFHVRPGVRFSDGVPLTADDVKWTFDWTMNPAVDAPRTRSYLEKIARCVRTGTDGVTFEFRQPYYDPVGLAGTNLVLPRHFYEPVGVNTFNSATGLLLGSGRYRMPDPKSWTPGKDVTLVRNDRYWGEPAALARVVYKIIVSDLPRLTAFTNGELDSFAANPVQYRSLLDNADVDKRCRHLEYETPSTGYSFIAWNQQRGGKPTRFADRRVRQAMTLLCDRQRVCDDVLLGQSTVATGPFNRLGKQNAPDIQPYPYDVERAKALLKEAGYTDDGTGVLKGQDGKPFVVRVTYSLGSPVRDRIMLVFKDGFAKAGVQFEPDRLDWSAFNQRMKNRDFDAINLAWTAGLESDLYQIFDSSQIADGGDDFTSYRNPDLDAVIRKARETLDESARMPMWRKCHAILHEDQPYTFLYTSKTLMFLDRRIDNVHLLRAGLNDLTEWYVPAAQQKYTQN